MTDKSEGLQWLTVSEKEKEVLSEEKKKEGKKKSKDSLEWLESESLNESVWLND